MTIKGHERISWFDGNVLYLDCDSGYMDVYISQEQVDFTMLRTYTKKSVAFGDIAKYRLNT